MIPLLEIEEIVRNNIDEAQLKLNLVSGLKDSLKNPEIIQDLRGEDFLNETLFKYEFSEITICVLNASTREPFFRAKIDVIDRRSGLVAAYYEQEYGLGMEVLDDLFVWD